jgi:large subunit ribosomal protein L13
MMKTYSVKASDIKREWHIIDASDEILGKLATRIARLLSGKHKPLFARNMDVGDFVVVINASKVRFSGNKTKQKMYYHHSGYPGGLRSEKLEDLEEKYPERVIENAVKGMLPRNKLNARMMKRLRIFAGADNPYGKPTPAANPAHEREKN